MKKCELLMKNEEGCEDTVGQLGKYTQAWSGHLDISSNKIMRSNSKKKPEQVEGVFCSPLILPQSGEPLFRSRWVEPRPALLISIPSEIILVVEELALTDDCFKDVNSLIRLSSDNVSDALIYSFLELAHSLKRNKPVVARSFILAIVGWGALLRTICRSNEVVVNNT